MSAISPTSKGYRAYKDSTNKGLGTGTALETYDRQEFQLSDYIGKEAFL